MNEVEGNALSSFDEYYLRDRKRDKKYEHRYRKRKNIDGMRIKTTMSARTYL